MGFLLFFVISGFAVTSSLFSAKHAHHSVARRIVTFFARRAFRIWPIYFGYIAVSAIFILAFKTPGALAEVPWLLTFTQNIKMIIESYAPGTVWGGFAHLWTLSDEQQFYVVFPFVLLLPTRRLRTIGLVGVIILAPVIRYAVGAWSLDQHYDALHAAFAVYAFGPGHFDAFAAGGLIALYRQEIADNIRWAKIAGALAVLLSAIYVLAYLFMNIKLSGHLSVGDTRNILSGVLFGQGRQILVYYVPTSLGIAMLMGIIVRNGALLRICNLPGLQAIGRISYGGYLYHVPVLMILGAVIPAFAAPVTGPASYLTHILLFLAASVITVVAALFSYNYLEQPFNRFAQRRMG